MYHIHSLVIDVALIMLDSERPPRPLFKKTLNPTLGTFDFKSLTNARSARATLFGKGSPRNHSNHSRTTLLQLQNLPQDISSARLVTNGTTSALAL
jgi:hypothetical protein